MLTADKALRDLADYFAQARDLAKRRAEKSGSALAARERDVERDTFEHAREMVESYIIDLESGAYARAPWTRAIDSGRTRDESKAK